ncbi:MAG: hypothetical protein PHP20_10280 [Firmicutes bacterium]|nr:hypothetical protein [Bacillota bacterium]
MRESDITLSELVLSRCLRDADLEKGVAQRESYLERSFEYVKSLPKWRKRFFHELACGRFEEAAKIADAQAPGAVMSIMFELSYTEPDLREYTYWIARLTNRETADDHASASQTLAFDMASVDGCCSTAVAHRRRAIVIDPHDVWMRLSLCYDKGSVRGDLLSWYDIAELREQLRQVVTQDYGIALEDLKEMDFDPHDPLYGVQSVLREAEEFGESPELLARLHADSLTADWPIEEFVDGILRAAGWADHASAPDDVREFVKLVFLVKYDEADTLARELGESTVQPLLDALSSETPDICSYAFWAFRLIKHETAYNHSRASGQIRRSLYKLKGAPEAGLFHARRAALLAPDESEYKERVLEYHGQVSERVFSRQEAIRLGRKVLASNPGNREVQALVERLDQGESSHESEQG